MWNQITVAVEMILTLWMIITNRQILHQLGYVDKRNYVLAIKLQCYNIIITEITIHDHAMMTIAACMCLALYSEYHIGIAAVVACVCTHVKLFDA